MGAGPPWPDSSPRQAGAIDRDHQEPPPGGFAASRLALPLPGAGDCPWPTDFERATAVGLGCPPFLPQCAHG
eukprot:2717504-Alexandrium_andersonii.AAC.1